VLPSYFTAGFAVVVCGVVVAAGFGRAAPGAAAGSGATLDAALYASMTAMVISAFGSVAAHITGLDWSPALNSRV
jgi:hypothetical protein